MKEIVKARRLALYGLLTCSSILSSCNLLSSQQKQALPSKPMGPQPIMPDAKEFERDDALEYSNALISGSKGLAAAAWDKIKKVFGVEAILEEVDKDALERENQNLLEISVVFEKIKFNQAYKNRNHYLNVIKDLAAFLYEKRNGITFETAAAEDEKRSDIIKQNEKLLQENGRMAELQPVPEKRKKTGKLYKEFTADVKEEFIRSKGLDYQPDAQYVCEVFIYTLNNFAMTCSDNEFEKVLKILYNNKLKRQQLSVTFHNQPTKHQNKVNELIGQQMGIDNSKGNAFGILESQRNSIRQMQEFRNRILGRDN